MKKWLIKILGQKSSGRSWGVFAQAAGQVAIFVGVMNLFLITATAYNTTLKEWLIQQGIDIGFWVFALVILGLILAAFMVMWKFALPSYYSSINEQLYRHDNPIRKDLEELKKILTDDLGDIKKRLDNLEKKEK